MQITTKELDRRLRCGFVGGSYLFYGDEPYLKDYYIKKLRGVICPDPDFEVFNHVMIENGDTGRFAAELSGAPLFGLGRLVELRGTDFGKLPTDRLERLCALISSPDSGLTIIIDTKPDELPEGTPKKPSAVLAALTKAADCLKFERQTPARLADWLGRHFTAAGVKADDRVCRYMIDFCSADMYILASEVEKLAAYAKATGSEAITTETVRTVCSPNRVFGAFDFSNAIISGDRQTALAAFADMRLRKEPPERILGTISRIAGELLAVKKLSDSGVSRPEMSRLLGIADYPLGLRLAAVAGTGVEKLAETVRAVNETDKKLKTTSADGYLMIEQLILFGIGHNNK